MKNIISKLESKLDNSAKNNVIYNTSFINEDYSNNYTNERYKKAAVLCLLDYRNENLYVVLTLRAKNLKTHPGQISFPGGKLDKGETNYDCAIRETYEEIGIKKKKY